jgi:hypothetical protein
MTNNSPSPDLLEKVYFDNLRDHQIGGLSDGITSEVAKDIGFQTLEDMKALIALGAPLTAASVQLGETATGINPVDSVREKTGFERAQVTETAVHKPTPSGLALHSKYTKPTSRK